MQCGSRMYAVGRFSRVKWHGRTFTRNNAFSFLATAPFTMSGWNPDVNGEVNSIAFSGGCGSAFLGGSFSSVHGTRAANIAKVDVATGRVVTRFRHGAADAPVLSLVASHGHLLAGGQFTSVNGSADSYLASLSPVTGRDDGFARLGISGRPATAGPRSTTSRSATTAAWSWPRARSPRSAASAAADRDAPADRAARDRHRLDVDRSSSAAASHERAVLAAVRGLVAGRPRRCTWRPPGSGPFGPPNRSFRGLCDAAAAFPATQATFVRHRWVNYTGCDSLFATAATSRVAFFAGHQRWADNRHGLRSAGRARWPHRGWSG